MAKEGAEAKGVAMDNWPSQLDRRCCYSLRHGAVKDRGMGYRDHGSDFGHTEFELSLMKEVVEVLSRELEKKI